MFLTLGLQTIWVSSSPASSSVCTLPSWKRKPAKICKLHYSLYLYTRFQFLQVPLMTYSCSVYLKSTFRAINFEINSTLSSHTLLYSFIGIFLGKYTHKDIRCSFKTLLLADRRFRPVSIVLLAGFYCSEQWQPPETGWNGRSTGSWVLKSPLRHSVHTPMHFYNNMVHFAFVKQISNLKL